MELRGDLGAERGPSDGLLVRANAWSALAGPIVFGAVAAGWVWAGLAGWVLAWIVALPMLLLTLTTGRAALRGFGDGNWVLRTTSEGLELRLRSFWNNDLPGDEPIVVRLEWHELAFARRCTVDGSRPDFSRGTLAEERDRRRYLELWTRVPVPGEVVEALGRERSRRAHGRTHFHHHFVSLVGERCLRIDFGGRHAALSPSLKATLAAIGDRVHVQQPVELTESAWSDLAPEELDERILALIERGDRVRAIAALRAAYGFNLAEAKHFVDDLDAPEATAAA
ncbi:MAG: hypothetical protein AAFZ65_09980 [Planctomycetota bacterium]